MDDTLSEKFTFGKNERENSIFGIIFFILSSFTLLQAEHQNSCLPEFEDSGCQCYNFEDGSYLECSGDAWMSINKDSENINGTIYSLTIFDIDNKYTILDSNFFFKYTKFRHIHISQSNIKDIEDNAFTNTHETLETLSVVSGNISIVPQKAISALTKVISLNLESNCLHELQGYSFYGLPLIKLNFKGNELSVVSESTFTGLEGTLSELDLSENNLRELPLKSFCSLFNLRTLRISWNDIAIIPKIANCSLEALGFLDLSFNNLVVLSGDCFRSFPSIKSLFLYSNNIKYIDELSFKGISSLESIDLSGNMIKHLNKNTFQYNKLLRTIDISQNQMHEVGNTFSNLPVLNELFLSKNNILKVPKLAFNNSTSLNIIDIEHNAIKYFELGALETLISLKHLYVGFNFLSKVPHDLLNHNIHIVSIRLNNNKLNLLQDILFKNLSHLKELKLNHNNIPFIDENTFKDLLHLQHLELHNNNISRIDNKAFDTLNKLKTLSLHNNNLGTLNDIFPKNNTMIESIRIETNQLKSIKAGVFYKIVNLDVIILIDNSLDKIHKDIFIRLNKLKKLHLSKNFISEIENYSFIDLTSLMHLDLGFNKIKKICNFTFEGLTELEYLDLSFNSIELINSKTFNVLNKIRVLKLSHNKLHKISANFFHDTRTLPLRELEMDNCSIQSIDDETFKGLNNLNTLSLSRNFLLPNTVAKLNLHSLRVLKLSHNKMENLTSEILEGMPLLEHVDLSFCRISYLPLNIFEKNVELSHINLAGNLINDINNLSLGNKIKEIRLDNNSFSKLPYDILVKLPTLVKLNMANNYISDLNLDFTKHTLSLRILILKGNQIKSIPMSNNFIFPKLDFLDISANKLAKLPLQFMRSISEVYHVDVSKNYISNLFIGPKDVKSLEQNLVFFNINYNELKKFDYVESSSQKITSLFELHISHCEMIELVDETFDSFPSLLHLFLKNNSIGNISQRVFSNILELKSIDLSHNNIEYFYVNTFKGLINLVSLNVSNNRLVSFATGGNDLKSLQQLDISHNNINEIKEDFFQAMENIEDVYLGNNSIAYVSENCTRKLKNIVNIDLSFNNLQDLSTNMLEVMEAKNSQFNILGNPLICSCKLRDYWIWVNNHPKVHTVTNLHCLSPDDFQELYFEKDFKNLCNYDMTVDLSIGEVLSNAALLSWTVINDTGIFGYSLIYYTENKESNVARKILGSDVQQLTLDGLLPSTHYVVCLAVLLDSFNDELMNNETLDGSLISSSLLRTSTSKCVTIITSNEKKTVTRKYPVRNAYSGLASVLTRRLGLIVGCSLGVVVFIIMVSVLAYTKSNKRRLIPDPDQQYDFPSYRTSLQIGESETVIASNTNFGDNILLGVSGDIRIKVT